MNICSDSKPERSERNSECHMQSRQRRRVPEPKALVTDMNRVRNSADHPRRQTPHLYMTGRHGKHDANESVHDAENYHRTKPRLPTRLAHIYRLTDS